jgi:hypothetical protein
MRSGKQRAKNRFP